MANIIRILAEAGSEPCEVDVNVMHETLLQLPADKYLELYHIMQRKVIGEPYWGCNCGFLDDTTAESKV